MIRNTEEFLAALRAARRASTPLVSIRTADPSAVALTARSLNGDADTTSLLSWDIMTGLSAVNGPGKKMLDSIIGERNLETVGPADGLSLAAKLGDDAVLFYANPQRLWHDPVIVQGLWNLRDTLKAVGAVLVLTTPPGSVLPQELTQDVLAIDEPLPAHEDLRAIVRTTFDNAKLAAPSADDENRAVDALLGLAAFPGEQVVAMSLSKRGLDHDQLWERKRQVIEQAPGLTVWRGGEAFTDVGGWANVKAFLQQSAEYIVPVARSAADQIESLRQQSSGKYLSASHPGVYEYNRNVSTPKARAFRALERVT